MQNSQHIRRKHCFNTFIRTGKLLSVAVSYHTYHSTPNRRASRIVVLLPNSWPRQVSKSDGPPRNMPCSQRMTIARLPPSSADFELFAGLSFQVGPPMKKSGSSLLLRRLFSCCSNLVGLARHCCCWAIDERESWMRSEDTPQQRSGP
jgi:hypothetical protein